ncbi:MAG: helix-turn-helix transcriptional regulator [Prevotellaceae bacterium]|jgi:AraC family transcriptional regulator|nr:helix-turn-helix transcriptional regulator [Prevotellaceae bacterium]
MKAYLGEAVGTFIVRMRVETAAKLLRYTNMSISDIAYQVGYDVPSSLSKTFKMFYNISPNEYRNNKKNYNYEINEFERKFEFKISKSACFRAETGYLS